MFRMYFLREPNAQKWHKCMRVVSHKWDIRTCTNTQILSKFVIEQINGNYTAMEIEAGMNRMTREHEWRELKGHNYHHGQLRGTTWILFKRSGILWPFIWCRITQEIKEKVSRLSIEWIDTGKIIPEDHSCSPSLVHRQTGRQYRIQSQPLQMNMHSRWCTNRNVSVDPIRIWMGNYNEMSMESDTYRMMEGHNTQKRETLS